MEPLLYSKNKTIFVFHTEAWGGHADDPVSEWVAYDKMQDYFINRRGLVMSDDTGKARINLMHNEIDQIEQE